MKNGERGVDKSGMNWWKVARKVENGSKRRSRHFLYFF